MRSSGLCWHDRFAETLRELGFYPSKADADVWMRECNNCYEYIAVYVDDLALAVKDPQELIDQLTKQKGYKLKGVEPLEYHLGCNFERDKDGTLRAGSKKYIEMMML